MLRRWSSQLWVNICSKSCLLDSWLIIPDNTTGWLSLRFLHSYCIPDHILHLKLCACKTCCLYCIKAEASLLNLKLKLVCFWTVSMLCLYVDIFENKTAVLKSVCVILNWDYIKHGHLSQFHNIYTGNMSEVFVFLFYAVASTTADVSSFRFLCRFLFLFSPGSVFFRGGVGPPFFFFLRQLSGWGLLCFLFLFLPRRSPSFWLMPCSSFMLMMLCCCVGLTSSPSCTAWTWSRVVWLGLSSTMVLEMM